MNLEAWIVAEGYALDEVNLQDKDGNALKCVGDKRNHEYDDAYAIDYVQWAENFEVHVSELRVVDQANGDYDVPLLTVELDI